MWPDLATAAREYLCCPPTSVPSERVFSMAADVVTPHRTCLDPGLGEQLVLLKVNLPLPGVPKRRVQAERTPPSSLHLEHEFYLSAA